MTCYGGVNSNRYVNFKPKLCSIISHIIQVDTLISFENGVMTNSWKDDNCEAMKVHYAVYSVQEAAARWCGVTDDLIKQVLREVTQLSGTGFGRGVWIHPDAPCIEPRSRAIAEGIESGLLPHRREDAQPVGESGHVAYERRHVFGRDLKVWMEKAFPNDKPAFLFDDIEQNSHTSITADAYRALKADRDRLQKRVDKSIESFVELRSEKEAIELERDSLKNMVEKNVQRKTPSSKQMSRDSKYWQKFSASVRLAITSYKAWSDNQPKVQMSGNLQDWLVNEIKVDNREAEIIKKVLKDIYKELR